ncbi:hypothetical protein CASFOL_022788 [Castilleja foliolosa]|uniref:Leucine-rich repeat-containing N-terminal plant-type domain-containing protein n=1 Tax=Castilleja foliolosa TaxID=1961234 RepID=A0ABD3CTD7_9LAMI
MSISGDDFLSSDTSGDDGLSGHFLSFGTSGDVGLSGLALLRFKEKVTSDPNGASLNWIDEIGIESPCNWFGIECFQGYVVALYSGF